MLGHVLRRQGILSTSLPRLLHGMQDTSRQMDTTWKISGTPWACDDVLSLLNWKRSCSTVGLRENSLQLGSYSKLEEDHFRAIKIATLLNSLNAYNFRRQLEELPIEQVPMDYEQLVQLARDSGAASTLADGHQLCDALVTAGVALRYGNRVYINPREVADEIRSCLPESIEKTRQLVSELEAELGPLQQKKEAFDLKVSRIYRYMAWMGLVFLIQKFAMFWYLTYTVYSWDVTAPLAYFDTLATVMSAYWYFVILDKPFKVSSIRTFIGKTYSRMGGGASFDALKYETLTKKLARHRRFLNKYSQ